MLLEKNVASEFMQGRAANRRPYIIDVAKTPHAQLDLMRQISEKIDLTLLTNSNLITQKKEIEPGKQDVMISTLETGYLIASRQPGGIKIMPDRLILPSSPKDDFGRMKTLYRALRGGEVRFDYYKRGEFGAVGFNPTINGVAHPEICIKFFNHAYPFTEEDWKTYMSDPVAANKKMQYKKWRLSGVTGIGQYVGSRYLRAAGIRTPDVYLATSELLVQEMIDGYTISEIQENYDELIQSGEVTVEEADNLWDVIDEMAARAESKVMSVIAPIKKEYWAPDFQDYDVNWGNIIIPKKGLQHPLETYVLIDPFR